MRKKSRAHRRGLEGAVAATLAAPGALDSMRLYTPRELADMLRVSGSTIKRLVYGKRIGVVRIGGRGLLRFRKEDVKDAIDALLETKKPD